MFKVGDRVRPTDHQKKLWIAGGARMGHRIEQYLMNHSFVVSSVVGGIINVIYNPPIVLPDGSKISSDSWIDTMVELATRERTKVEPSYEF